MKGHLRLLNIACAAKAKCRQITLQKPSRESPLFFTLQGGSERSFGIFVETVEEASKAAEAGLKRGDQVQITGTRSALNNTYHINISAWTHCASSVLRSWRSMGRTSRTSRTPKPWISWRTTHTSLLLWRPTSSVCHRTYRSFLFHSTALTDWLTGVMRCRSSFLICDAVS